MQKDALSAPPAATVRRGPDWSAGGWFGSLSGLTAWLLIASFVLLLRDPWASIGPAAALVATLSLGAGLWRNRSGRSMRGAMTVLVAVAGLLALGALLWVDLHGRLADLWTASGGAPAWPRIAYTLLLVYPGVIALLWLQRGPAAPSGPAAPGRAGS